MNDDRDSVKGSQHTACVIQPISLLRDQPMVHWIKK